MVLYTKNYGTLIYEGKIMVLYQKTMNRRFSVEKAMVTYQSIEVFKQLLLQNSDLLWKKIWYYGKKNYGTYVGKTTVVWKNIWYIVLFC